MKNLLIGSLSLCLFFACGKEEIKTNTYPANYYTENYGNPQIKNKVYYKNGRTYLWGGEDTLTHFDISIFSLKIDQLKFGLGRERFPALISPEYGSIEQADQGLNNADKCLILKGDNNLVKVYPYKIMLEYEVVNDVIDGEPVMVAYCVLADLAAVYTRRYCEQILTFGLSGYTYADPFVWGGLDGFVLWDRETESLWWPLIDRAVSSSMIDVSLKKHNESKWTYETWGEVKANYSFAKVLIPGQKVTEDVSNWPKIPAESLDCN